MLAFHSGPGHRPSGPLEVRTLLLSFDLWHLEQPFIFNALVFNLNRGQNATNSKAGADCNMPLKRPV